MIRLRLAVSLGAFVPLADSRVRYCRRCRGGNSCVVPLMMDRVQPFYRDANVSLPRPSKGRGR